jgi:DNA-binding MarR family transcriptional regulator
MQPSLSTLISHALIAFTIEFDNEFERQMPHRTTDYGLMHNGIDSHPRGAPWLVSLAMYLNFMRFVHDQGVSLGEIQSRAGVSRERMRMLLAGMARWGYILVEADARGVRSKAPRSNQLIRPTAAGRRARDLWQSLFEVIEERWRARFGSPEVNDLRASLAQFILHFDHDLPDFMPVLGYGLSAEIPDTANQPSAPPVREPALTLPLPSLLSKALLAFTVEFERDSPLSLAMCANFLRVLDETGVRSRDLPRLSGVAKDAVKNQIGFLERNKLAVVEAEAQMKSAKVVRLTTRGLAAKLAYLRRARVIEEGWRARFGEDAIRHLRQVLGRLVGDGSARNSPLFLGLEAYADGWRAAMPKPETLPHYPLVLHRGGFPDGS